MAVMSRSRLARLLAAWLSPLVLPLLLLLAGGCDPASPTAQPPPAAAGKTNVQYYAATGVVQELQLDKKKLKIAHEKIPGYMDAMVMLLDVKEAKDFDGLQAGDTIVFRLVDAGDDGWIEQIKRLDVPRVAVAQPPSFRRVREVEPLAVGDLMPDYTFTNTQGRVVRLSDFKGEALAVTFIFTRCPFPTFCPRLSGNFAETQSQMKALSGGPTNWHLLSITIDPEYDTPARLQAYAERFHADPKRWDFVTGELLDITAIGEQFGLQFWRAQPTEPIQHNVRTIVIDAAGRVQWKTVENEWKPAQMVEQLVKAAAVPR